MESQGAEVIDLRTSPSSLKSGDLMVIPFNNYDLHVPPRNRIASQQIHTFPGPRFVSTMSLQSGAGFYSDVWGPLPFAFGRVIPEGYAVIGIR